MAFLVDPVKLVKQLPSYLLESPCRVTLVKQVEKIRDTQRRKNKEFSVILVFGNFGQNSGIIKNKKTWEFSIFL